MPGRSSPRWKPQSATGRLSLPLNRRSRRTLLLLVCVALAYFLLSSLHSLRERKKKPYVARPPPRYDVEAKPHFLYTSPFRENPDLEFEAKLEDALRRIENGVLSGSGRAEDGNNVDRIWQVMLQKRSSQVIRKKESEQFEERNPEWKYTVRTFIAIIGENSMLCYAMTC